MTALRNGVLILLATVLAVGGWWVYSDPRRDVAVETPAVSVIGEGFAPGVAVVSAGTTVVWTFTDTVEHNVQGEGWGSPVISTGGSFSHRFDDPGTYDYVCSLHPLFMRGRVTVT